LREQRHQEWGDLEDEEVDVEQLKKQMQRQSTQLHQCANWLTELRGKLGFIRDMNTLEGHLQGLEQFLDDWQLPQHLTSLLKKEKGYQIDWFKRDLACLEVVKKSIRQ